MNWTEMLSDWKTWATVYLLILVFPTPPTVRHITRNWKPVTTCGEPDRFDLGLLHATSFCMMIFGPFTIIIYWVFWVFLCRFVFGKGLGLGAFGCLNIAEIGLPKQAWYPERRKEDELD